jgi:hypothetical protein
MVHTTIVLKANIISHDTKAIIEDVDLKSILDDFDTYLDTVTWDDDLTIEAMTVLEIQQNHYIFIDVDHELPLETLDVILQEWVIQSEYSPYLNDILNDRSVYLDLVDAMIVTERTVPTSFNHPLTVTLLDDRTFLTEDQKVIKLTPPTLTVLGIKDGNTIRPLDQQ